MYLQRQEHCQNGTNDDDAGIMNDGSTTTTALYAYMASLTVLLQGYRTGLYNRTSASSPFLTQLSFSGKVPPQEQTRQRHGGGGASLSTNASLFSLLWLYIVALEEEMEKHPVNCDNYRGFSHFYCTWSIFWDIVA